MRFTAAFFLLSTIFSGVFADPVTPRLAWPKQRTCGNDFVPTWAKADAPLIAEQKVASKVPIAVQVWFHVIQADASVGNLPASTLNQQLNVLNAQYASSNFQFTVVGTTRTTNANWFYYGIDNYSVMQQMKGSLRRGTYRTLNVYFLTSQSGTLGISAFPVSNPTTAQRTNDGIVIDYRSVPGGSLAPYNLGVTLTHEVGHWLNLYHTFTNGCNEPGDFISDTPAEASPAFGCPVGRDSCTAIAGYDPITNFMDYSDDACMTNFSPLQRTRMQQSWQYYRANF